MPTLGPDQFVHATTRDALDALQRVGADPDAAMEMTVEVDGIGPIKRVFGLLGNVIEKRGMVEEPVVVERLLTLLDDPDNRRIRERLERGQMRYTPVNKRALRRIAEELLPHGVHLPWTFRPMNFDFAAKVAAVHKASPLPFLVFYSQQITLAAGAATTGRLYSLPIEGHAQGTWAEPIYDELLDPDVGLLIEANARA